MKYLTLFFTLLCICSNTNAQDSTQINSINLLVNAIVHSNFPTEHDSTVADYPALGLSMKTHLTMVTYGKDLKKYAQVVKSTRQENNVTKQMTSGSAFYYDQNKLIKVEEFLIEDGKEHKAEWYFSNDKCFYYTLKTPDAEKRIPLLLTMSNSFLKPVTQRH